MKIVVSTFYYPNYKKLAEKTVDINLKNYCQKWGYEFLPFELEEMSETDPYKRACIACQKNTELILKTLTDRPEVDYFFHRDCDSIIMNMNLKLEDLIDFYKAYDIVTGGDKAGISMGQVVVKNTPVARNYLKEVLNGIEHGYEHEQKYMWDNPRDFIVCTPQRLLNSYDCEARLESLSDPANFKSGDFVVHLAGLNLDQKMGRVDRWMSQVQGATNES